MKKIILLLSYLILIFVSCTNDSVVNPINNNDPILVKKIIVKNLADDSIINVADFEYVGNKILKSSDQNGYKIMYTYSGDLISNMKIVNSNNVLASEYLFVYQNDNLIQSKYIRYLDNVCEKRLYTYNSNGSVDFIYYNGDLSNQNVLSKSGSINIQNGEVTGEVIQDFMYSSNSRSTINTYDNNNNPSKNVIGFNKLDIELDRVGGSFKNLISISSNYNSNTIVTTDFTYTYNSNGYPISSTLLRSDGLNYKTEYLY